MRTHTNICEVRVSAEKEKRKEGRVPSEQEWVGERARNVQTGNKQDRGSKKKKKNPRQAGDGTRCPDATECIKTQEMRMWGKEWQR